MTGFRIPLPAALAAQDASRATRVAIAAHVFSAPVVRPVPRAAPMTDARVW
jgi:hypothetical protein